jgi:hypothetical protein
MSPDPTPTPTSTVTPAGIQNGDLETGDFTCWAHGGSYPQSVVPQLSNGEPPYQGNYCASLGMPVPCISQTAALAWMYQEFIVPNVHGTVTISFAYRIFTNDIYDWASFHVELRAPDDALLTTILRDGYRSQTAVCGNDLGWKTFSYNLEAFKGQTVRIYFESKNEWDGGWSIWTYVDDVKLQTTPTVTPTRTVTTPTVTPTCTVTPTPTATPPCFELVVNGGFETAGGWATSSADRSTDQAHSGQWSMLVGQNLPSNQTSYASARQLIAIPSNATSATLAFWYWLASADTDGDLQMMFIYDQDMSHRLATVFSTLSNTQTWTPVIFDLSPWIGQGINLYFGVKNDDDGLLTRMYVDEVSVCCWTGTATQTPTPTSTYTRTVTPTPTTPASTGSLCVLVYNDGNGNRLRDPDEGLLSGAIVTVTTAGGALVGVRFTDGTEPYCFTGLAPGAYVVKEQNPPGYMSTTLDIWGVTVDAGYSTVVEFGDLALSTPTSTYTRTVTPTPTDTPKLTATLTPISPASLRLYLPLIMKRWLIWVTDTPTPTPTGLGVYVLPNHSYYVDSINYIHVVGEVQNNTANNLRYVKIAANFFNSNNQLVGTDYTYTYLDNLPAYTKTCFMIWLLQPAGWSYYQFEPPTYSTGGHAFPNLTVLGPSGSYDPTYGRYTVLGQVRNDSGTRVQYVQPVGTLYTVSNTVVGCDYTYVNSTHLDPNQTSAFKMTFYGRNYSDVASYRLQVDGTPQ